MHSLGFRLVVVTNQPGVGRGFLSREQVQRVNARLEALLKMAGVVLDSIQVCLHALWNGCACRKPGTEMFDSAALELGITLSRSFVIDDRDSDNEAGKRIGARTVLISEQPGTRADFSARNL